MAYRVNETGSPGRDRDRHTSNGKLASLVSRWASSKKSPSPLSPPSTHIPRQNSHPDDLTLFAYSAVQTIHPALRPPHLPRSSISSDVSSIGSSSKSTSTLSVYPHDIHPAFRKNVYTYLGMPLHSMNEDPELLWAPDETKFDPISVSPLTPTFEGPRPASLKTPVRDPSRLPIFAFSPAEKIVIDPTDMKEDETQGPVVELARVNMLPSRDKSESHATTVYALDLSAASHVLASKHGDKTIKIHSLPHRDHLATLKIAFYIQMRDRSRDFFVTSHAILSESRSLIAVATNFGHTLEIWDWARRKKLQTIPDAYRWAIARLDIYDAPSGPGLACYSEDTNTIALYPVQYDDSPLRPKTPPLGAPNLLHLSHAGLPHLPKLPELALSTTSPPILVAAAGPRPPRPGHPPPAHGALLMAWHLGAGGAQNPRPWRFTALPALATALPCGLATHGRYAVSLWLPHSVRVIGQPGAWQVEPVAPPVLAARWVVVWDMEAAPGSSSAPQQQVFAIPNVNTLACISPDCRFVAYRQGPGTGQGGCLVVLDALRGGREVWRTPRMGGGCRLERDCGQLMDLSRITSIAFSADGGQFLIGDVSGSVGVYQVRTVGDGSFALE